MDDLDEFFGLYEKHLPEISAKVMLTNLGQIDPELLDAQICWMVTDNLQAILAKQDQPQLLLEQSNRTYQIADCLEQELSQDRLVIIGQDLDETDHWFALIGSGPWVHLIEYSPYQCLVTETRKREQMIAMLIEIASGVEPDRFYQVRKPHRFTILSMERRPLSIETIQEFLAN